MICTVCKNIKGLEEGTKEDLSQVRVFSYANEQGELVRRMYCTEKCFDDCPEFYTLNMGCEQCRSKPAIQEHCLAIQFQNNGNYLLYRVMCSAECHSTAYNLTSLKAGVPDYSCELCKKEAALGCNRCRKVRYCGRECQVAHWKLRHKNECDKK